MKVYFPGLNGIRAIAALVVICFHVNSTMWFFGSTPVHYFEKRDEMSRHAVVLFFVLSGFLITYLLATEKKRFGTIDVKKFYARRILRIWPLFYAALGLALVTACFNRFGHSFAYSLKSISLYALFIPNFALMAGWKLPTIAPLWSIGVEEQFYAVWPLMLKKTKSLLLFLTAFLFVYIAIKLALLLTGNVWSTFSINFNFFSYDTMAIGGLAAWLYANNHKSLAILYHPLVELVCWTFFIVSCTYGPFDFHYIINKEIYSLVFAIMILNVSTNPKAIIKLRGKQFDFLGTISYGMYVLHPFVIVLVSYPLKYVVPSIPGKPLQLIFICAVILPLTVLSAWLSFRFFESKFLKKKEYYSKVISTNQREKTETRPAQIDEQALSL